MSKQDVLDALGVLGIILGIVVIAAVVVFINWYLLFLFLVVGGIGGGWIAVRRIVHVAYEAHKHVK